MQSCGNVCFEPSVTKAWQHSKIRYYKVPCKWSSSIGQRTPTVLLIGIWRIFLPQYLSLTQPFLAVHRRLLLQWKT